MLSRASVLGLLPTLLVLSVAPAAAMNASAASTLEHLRRVMDRYHDRFIVYEDVSAPGNHFHAWAEIPGENAAVTMNGSWNGSPHAGATAIRAEFQDVPGANFGGFYLLNGILPDGAPSPQANFGTVPDAGINLTGATALTFWARGQDGGEIIEFFMGGVGRDPNTGQPVSPYPDSTPVVKQTFVLTTQWTQYSLDLTGRILGYVLGGFGWVASDAENSGGAIFFMDDIEYQLGPAARAARLDQPRFLRSFETEPFQSQPPPVGDFDLRNRNAAHTYDNALALLAFLAEGSADGQVSRALATIGKCGIPASAVALVVNVTVVGPTGPGYLTLHPGDLPLPLAATLTFAPGQLRTNNAIVPMAVDGEGTVRLQPLVGGNGSVHVVLDVSGYFE